MQSLSVITFDSEAQGGQFRDQKGSKQQPHSWSAPRGDTGLVRVRPCMSSGNPSGGERG